MSLKSSYRNFYLAIRRRLIRAGYMPVHPNPHGWVPRFKTWLDALIFGRSSYAQQGEDLTLDRILVRKLGFDLKTYQGLYVDAGAYHPVSHSTSYLLYQRGWQGVCIDIAKSSCQIISRRRPRDLVLNYATSNQHERLAFKDPGLISLIHEAKPAASATDAEHTIEAYSLTELLSNNGITREIDYLNIDTEGAELKTLQGLDFDRYKPKVISVEIHEANVPSALKTEVANYLAQQGYDCVASNVITYFFIRAELNT